MSHHRPGMHRRESDSLCISLVALVLQTSIFFFPRESVGLYCGENLTEEKKGEVNSSQTKQRERCQRSMGRALVHDHLLVHSEVTVTSELHAEVDAAAARTKIWKREGCIHSKL